MVYGPIAAWLVELFPTRIRYIGLSLPYHIGNGWFGGFLPATVFAIVAATGNIYSGLWYPIVVAAMSFVVGADLPARDQGSRHHHHVTKRRGGRSRPPHPFNFDAPHSGAGRFYCHSHGPARRRGLWRRGDADSSLIRAGLAQR